MTVTTPVWTRQLIVESTRITSDSQTLIDIIATSHPRNYKRPGITLCGISDHLLDTCHPLLQLRQPLSDVTIRATGRNFLEDMMNAPLEDMMNAPLEDIMMNAPLEDMMNAPLEDMMNAPWQSI